MVRPFPAIRLLAGLIPAVILGAGCSSLRQDARTAMDQHLAGSGGPCIGLAVDFPVDAANAAMQPGLPALERAGLVRHGSAGFELTDAGNKAWRAAQRQLCFGRYQVDEVLWVRDENALLHLRYTLRLTELAPWAGDAGLAREFPAMQSLVTLPWPVEADAWLERGEQGLRVLPRLRRLP